MFLFTFNCSAKPNAFCSCYWVQEKETEECETNNDYIAKKREPDTQIADIFVLLSHVYKTKIPIDFKAEV